ncbi:MAG: hypothetical protein LBT33_02935 [Spirochaetia bacterium]|jgi:hypothetical protein|nr:hypothetical protein [Spirochaetia bacterium]
MKKLVRFAEDADIIDIRYDCNQNVAVWGDTHVMRFRMPLARKRLLGTKARHFASC